MCGNRGGNSRWIKVFALCVMAGVTCLSVRADEGLKARPGWTLDRLMQGLSQVKAAKADFVEDQYIRMLTKPLRSSGVLIYVAPDRLEKNTSLPKPQSIVVVGDTITITPASGKPQAMKLQDSPEIEVLVESLLSTLNGNLAGLMKSNDVRLEGDTDHWQLLLTPTDQRLRKLVKTISISGQAFSLNSVEILQGDGDRSVIKLAASNP